MTEKPTYAQSKWYQRIPWGRYATEILVIFIGITVSFAFDQWKKDRENAEQERQLLGALRQDLRDKLRELESDSIGFARIYACGELLPHFAKGELKTEEDAQCLYMLLEQEYYFVPTTPSFEATTQNDQWKLVRNDSLKRIVLRLYTVDFKGVEFQYQNFTKLSQDYKRAYLLREVRIDPSLPGYSAIRNLGAILRDPALTTMLFTTRQKAMATGLELKMALASTRGVLKKLDAYLAES